MGEFVIASFRSRTQALAYSRLLSGAKIENEVINTPRGVSIGCGVSVKFKREDYALAKAIAEQNRFSALAGFYAFDKNKATPLSLDYTI